MTAPRQILPGSTYLITRRCSERRFFLTPSEGTNAIVRFCIALGARHHGVQVHAFAAMSNHLHMVVTDVHGELPSFMQRVSSLIARAMNSKLDRWESFWDPRGYNAVRLVDPEDIVAKTAYVIANPATAGLVTASRHWPGAITLTNELGRNFDVVRPRGFFRSGGPVPKRLRLDLTIPACFTSRREFTEAVTDVLTSFERRSQQDRKERGIGVVGTRRVSHQDPFARPRPNPATERSVMRPVVAAMDPSRRRAALQAVREFVLAYRSAHTRWRQGNRGAIFPAGTWWMRIQYGVVCAAPG